MDAMTLSELQAYLEGLVKGLDERLKALEYALKVLYGHRLVPMWGTGDLEERLELGMSPGYLDDVRKRMEELEKSVLRQKEATAEETFRATLTQVRQGDEAQGSAEFRRPLIPRGLRAMLGDARVRATKWDPDPDYERVAIRALLSWMEQGRLLTVSQETLRKELGDG